jgi:hypothetical protein
MHMWYDKDLSTGSQAPQCRACAHSRAIEANGERNSNSKIP